MKKVTILGLAAIALLLVGAVVGRLGTADRAQAQTFEETGDTRRAAEGARIRAEIQNDPLAPTVARKGADVTLVLFSDYQCPYCRKVHPALEQLMREDPKVKVVYRDWPIFGAGSVEAAHVAIAAKYQGKHAAFNNALMETPGKVSSQTIRAAANKAGVDWARLQADLQAHKGDIDALIDRNGRYAMMMGLSGTPALLVGPYLIPGAVHLGGLRKAVTLARTAPDAAAD
ncbi:DsbA family protein [Sphingomonas jeddahensis]|uniref:DSBA-like thioredoxin domain protein n=1 Tax=Sphingomonas jeddahensis TaxID=1915074 RepID=A0A1V2EXC0_9SPHN|nr:DsbA family protein [Sphingomonas jeddahensis]ONF97125.1 DSBA-like thioredoxin domain protein [Sphingomonas jeddahensis]